MIVEYSDLYAAAAIGAGVQWHAWDGIFDVMTVALNGGPDPVEHGAEAYDTMPEKRPIPTIVFHGTDDYTVYPCNGDESAEQATVTNDLALDDTDDGSPDYADADTTTGSGSSLSYTKYEYADDAGTAWVEHYEVDSMGHAWSGGVSGGEYTAPGGPDASQLLWNFFEGRTKSK